MTSLQEQALILLAYIFAETGKLEKARILLEALHELKPKDLYCKKALAYVYDHEGKTDQALEMIEKVMEEKIDRDEQECALLLKARAFFRNGEAEKARAEAEKLLELRAEKSSERKLKGGT